MNEKCEELTIIRVLLIKVAKLKLIHFIAKLIQVATFSKTSLFTTSSPKTHSAFERIINPPLETSESSNHNHTGTETLGGQVGQTDLAGNLSNRLALVGRLSELRHQ